MTTLSLPTLLELQEAILDRLREQLGDPSITVDDNFLDLGGHSLMAIELKTRLVEEYGVTLPLADLFRGTLADAAAAALGAVK
ncbi:acyl carrier protein [Streptomyces sp. NPDC054794]